MSKKIIWVANRADDACEVVKVCDREAFEAARSYAAQAADELRANGYFADMETVYTALDLAMEVLPFTAMRSSETVHRLYRAYEYMTQCFIKGDAVYKQYVYESLLDFVEPEHFTKEA